jgi:hypothetical protein
LTLPLAGAAPFLSRRSSDNVAPPTWRAVGRLLSTGHLLAWADQAVVSAASFLVLIMIGRWTDAGQLGTYALGNSLLVMLMWAQDALITRLLHPAGSHVRRTR